MVNQAVKAAQVEPTQMQLEKQSVTNALVDSFRRELECCHASDAEKVVNVLEQVSQQISPVKPTTSVIRKDYCVARDALVLNKASQCRRHVIRIPVRKELF